jgi:ABC-type bacteriocin/lantibiotic exporter with double-glycine peptidase domain
MTDPHPRTPGADRPANAVREQQRRLAAEFGAPRPAEAAPAGAVGPFEGMLCEILASVGWRGDEDRIFEVLPHLEPIRSVRTLRAVLARLDVTFVQTERSASDLSRADLPCLIVEADDKCLLLMPGAAQGIDAYALGAEARRPAAGLNQHAGQVYLLRHGKAADGRGPAPYGGFVGSVVKGLSQPLARIAGASAVINALGLLLSLYVLFVYDVIIATKSWDTLAFFAVGALAVLAGELRLRHARARMIAYLAARFDGVVSVRTLAAVLNLPLSMTERAPLTTQVSRFRQFEIGRELFAGNLASALFDLPFTLLFTAMLFVVGGLLGFVPVALALVIAAVAILFATLNAAQVARVSDSKLKSDALLFELTDKLPIIRNAAAESIWLGRYAESLATYQRARFGNLQLNSSLQILTNGLVGLAGIVTLTVGALRVMDSAMTVGELVAAMIIVWRVLAPVQIVCLNLSRLAQTLSTVRQINEVARLRAEREAETPPMLYRRLGGHVFASGVYLSNGAQHEPQLKGLNLEVERGEIIAITGPSGSGKSTLLKVLLGLYPHYMGTVRLGGYDLRQLDPTEVRAAIGYAPQQPAFFYGSVAANFRFTCSAATDADIMEALAAVGLSLPSPDLPDGLATRISGTGTRSLSQGVLMRLSLARALVKRPAMLFLDDPGTGLDRAGDDALIRHLTSLRGKTTVLLVTARPSHMRIADRVIEMRNGMVAMDGKPEVIVPRILKQISDSAA